MTLEAGELDRVLWQGTSSPTRRKFDRRLGPALRSLATWVAIAVGVLFVTGSIGTPGAWVIAAVILLPGIVNVIRAGVARPQPHETYTLTERRFVVESDRGRHAYDLGQFGEMTVDMHGDGTGDIGFRRPAVPLPPTLEAIVTTSERLGLGSRMDRHLLAHDLADAPSVLQRIEAARRDVVVSEPAPHHDLPRPTDQDRAPREPTVQPRPPLIAGLIVIAMGAVPIAAVMAGVAIPRNAGLAMVVGLVFVGLGLLTVWLWWSRRHNPPAAVAQPSAPRSRGPRALMFGLAAIGIGLLPIALVITGSAVQGSEVVAVFAGVLFAVAGLVLVGQWWIGRGLAPAADRLGGDSRAVDGFAAGIPPWFGILFAVPALTMIGFDLATGGPTVLSLLPAAFVVGGLTLSVLSLQARSRDARLRREGTLTRGKIVELQINRNRGGVAVYRYRLPDGRELMGQTRPVDSSRIDRWAVGDEIDVRYDPANPGVSTAREQA